MEKFALSMPGSWDLNSVPIGAFGYVEEFPFRQNSNRFALLIIDKTYRIDNDHGYNDVYELFDKLNAKDISVSVATLHTINAYDKWAENCNGIKINMFKKVNFAEEYTNFVLNNISQGTNFKIIASNTLKEIHLVAPLKFMGQTDTDEDGLTDSDEVQWNYVELKEDGSFTLPMLGGLWVQTYPSYDAKAFENLPFLTELKELRVLPLKSDPTLKDSDDDGYTDSEDLYPFKVLITKCHQEIIDLADRVSMQEHERIKKVEEWTTAKCLIWLSKGVINGEQGQQYLDEFENQWILCYKNVIVDAAEMYDIPPYMLAGVLKIELGGDPLWIDDPAYILRKFVYGQKRADQTSFGNISMQVGTAADTLDYNYQFLTNYSRDAIINSLKDNIQGIYIAAKHLSYLRNIDYKGMGAVDLTEEQVRNIATRYNLGPSKSLNEIENTSGYGQHVVNFRKTLEEILYGEE